MATPFAPSKLPIAYLNSGTPKPYYLRKGFANVLYRAEICAISSTLLWTFFVAVHECFIRTILIHESFCPGVLD